MVKTAFFRKKVILVILAILILAGIIAIIAIFNINSNNTPVKAVYVFESSKTVSEVL